jgi:hypothetical protein
MVQRIVVICGLATAGLVALLYGDTPPIAAHVPLLGFVSVSGAVALTAASVLAALCGAYDLAGGPERRHRLESALAPALLTLGWLLAARSLAPLLPGVLLPAALACSLALVLAAAGGESGGRRSHSILSIVAPISLYLTAYVVLTGVYALRLRALVSAPAIGLAAGLLAVLLWRVGRAAEAAERDKIAELTRGMAVGLVVAEAAWALLFWPVPPQLGGLVLLSVFYAASGVVGAGAGQADRRLLAAEFAAVALVAITAVLFVVGRMR